MKIKKTSVNKILLVLSLLFILQGGMVWAKETADSNIPKETPSVSNNQSVAGDVSATAEQMTVIADINFRNPIILRQEKNVVDIYFRLENNYSKSEAGIRYGVQLIKDKTRIDERVYTDDLFSIEENGSIQKIFTYEAPAYLAGEYDLWLVAKNESGLPLATFKLEKSLTLKGDREYLEIDQKSCVLKIDGEAADKKYNLIQGVSLKAEETLKLSCEAISHFKEFTIVAPIFNTYERTLFGNLVDKDQKGTMISFQLGEKKVIEFTIEKPSIPQAYEARLDLMRTSGDITSAANPIILHYVIAGESATIQKLDLDKISYQKGDAINATLLWSGSADNFAGSRMGATENSPVGLSLSISNQLGQECANTLEQKLEPNKEAKLALVAKANCADPKAMVILKNKQGIILAQKEFNFLKDEKIIPQKSSTRNAWVLGGLFILLIIILTLLWRKKKKSNFPATKALSLLVFALFGLSFGRVEALTLSNTAYNNWTNVVLNINLNKSVYDPGEQITTTTTGYAQIMDCANHDNNGVSLSGGTGSCYKNPIFWYGQSILGGGYVGINVSDSTCSAPTIPGTQRYSFNFSLTGEGANRDSGSGDIYYSVADNTPNPTCNISFGSSTYSVGDWGPLNWSSTNATESSLYCTIGNKVIANYDVRTSYTNFGVQLTSAGTAHCVLMVTNGAKSSTCSAQATVTAPPAPRLDGHIWFVEGLVYRVGQVGTVKWETENATTANLRCEGTPIDRLDPMDVPVDGTHRMWFNRRGSVICTLVISNDFEQSNLEISSNSADESWLVDWGLGKTAFGNTIRTIALAVTITVDDCVSACSGSCFVSNPNNGMVSNTERCCSGTCYACPTGTRWDGYTCAPPAPTCECTNGPFSGGSSCPIGRTCDGCNCIPCVIDNAGCAADICSNTTESCWDGCSYIRGTKICPTSGPTTPSASASFSPASIKAPGTTYLSWSSNNADRVMASCDGPLPVPWGDYGRSYSSFPFPFTSSQTGTETCSFIPYNGMVAGSIAVASVTIGNGFSPPIPPTPSCIADCSNVANVCKDVKYSDGCTGQCTGTKSGSCLHDSSAICTGLCGKQSNLPGCYEECSSDPKCASDSWCSEKTDCGPCNSGTWKEVAP